MYGKVSCHAAPEKVHFMLKKVQFMLKNESSVYALNLLAADHRQLMPAGKV